MRLPSVWGWRPVDRGKTGLFRFRSHHLLLAVALSLLHSACTLGPDIEGRILRGEGFLFSYRVESRSLPLEPGEEPGTLRSRIRIAGREYALLADLRSAEPRLLVDELGRGDLENARVLEGRRIPGEGGTPSAVVAGRVELRLPSGTAYPLYVSFGSRAGESGLSVEPAWLAGEVDLGGREVRFALRDIDADGSFSDLENLQLVLDRDCDDRFHADADVGEAYRGDARFDVGTGTFRLRSVSADGRTVVFARAWPPVSPRPFLGRGDAAPPLPVEDLEGRALSLRDFGGGKLLVLFWAPG